ncbi:GNAT family N-acetyltransferase [Lactobacillus johnsonii]|uniref:GNAT family N-acetyltransferase n=1 Tax=Lactobacillus johnsonii TaxID=33959 RepID=UPI001C693591|nr:GNAT family N-acetyltransferase [Lactobacillus johnsonii]MBW8460368.1 GNAT family N-acetyltransferase [Lactobacillus johnsonii]
MDIREVKDHKKKYLDLLLLADEQEDMVDRYLDRGKMYVLIDGGKVRSECVITIEDNHTIEIKNLATYSIDQGKGYAKKLINYISEKYKKDYEFLQVGTGDSPLTIPFYLKCGFKPSGRIKNFFVDNYNHPIYEAGQQLIDMVYLKKKI